jgi:uncharacterized protein (TIGR02118 family)
MSRPAIKLIVMMRKRPDISMDEFQTHYEVGHVPLALRTCRGISKYVRNYIHKDSDLYPTGHRAEYDCITEVWFGTEEDLKNFKSDFAETENARRIAEDEERFVDTSSVQFSR